MKYRIVRVPSGYQIEKFISQGYWKTYDFHHTYTTFRKAEKAVRKAQKLDKEIEKIALSNLQDDKFIIKEYDD